MTDGQCDSATIAAYDSDAAGFADKWESQPADCDLRDAVLHYFAPGPTADIGCGSGQETAWLSEQGFDVTGFDASQGLLQEARARNPGIAFVHAVLPDLTNIADASFANVLCETVIMHLPAKAVAAATRRLIEILAPGGTLYLTWVTVGADRRDEHGRLYAAFDPDLVLRALDGTALLMDQQVKSASTDKMLRRIVARKHPARADGNQRCHAG